MTNKYQISGSILALSAAGALPATAQDGLGGFTLDIKGGYGLSNASSADKLEEAGAPDGVIDEKLGYDNTKGFFGGARVSKSIDDWRDYGFALNGSIFSDSASNRTFDGAPGVELDANDRFTSLIADADFGWHKNYNGIDLRGFVGLRAAMFETEMDKGFSDGMGSTDIDKTGEFRGIGPRVGISADQRFAGSNFGWFAGSSASILYGTHKISIRAREDGSPATEGSESESGKAYTLDAQLGMDYYLNDNSKVSLGYQAEKFLNMWTDESDFPNSFNDRLSHGAFIGYSTQF